MINPRNVLLAIPSHTGSLSCELTGMLVNYGHRYFGGLTMPTECSHPSLVRNIIADTLLRSSFEWLVGIDADMVAGPEDFEYLMQEVDSGMKYTTDEEEQPLLSETGMSLFPPQPTRVETRLAPTALETATLSELRGMADVLVNCEYAYKREPFEPVHFGLGFYRVHRSVFSMLQQLRHSPGPTVEVSRDCIDALKQSRAACKELNDVDYARKDVEALLDSVQDHADRPRLWQVTHQGRMFHDYYPSGPITDLHVPNGQWMGEDHGFWTLCRLAGLVPRIERRTRLIHLGRKGYPYEGPDVGATQ